MKTTAEGRLELARAVRARHGVDPLASLAMRARFDLAIAELPEPAHEAAAPWLEPDVVDAIAARLRVGETRFYRDGAQLEAVADAVFRRAIAAGRCRVLSAGCSTGEEAWTLALMLDALASARGGAVAWEVVGVDVDRASVEHARAFRYPPSSTATLPARLRRRVHVRDGATEIDPAVAARCRFEVRDLLGPLPLGPFDAIFCRNVVVYLEEDAAHRLLGRLSHALAPGGALVVARAEVAVARRAGLASEEIGGRVVVFRRPHAGAEAPQAAPVEASAPIEPPPPSRARLVVRPDDDEASVAERARAALAGGAPVIEITIVGALGDERRARIGPAIRRLAAAVRARGGRLSPSDDATARALAALGA